MSDTTPELALKASRSRLRAIPDVITTLAMLVATAFIVYSSWTSGRPTPKGVAIPDEPLSIETAARRGSDSAKVGILAFSDFQCPFCAKFAAEIMPKLEEAYIRPGKVLFAFKHLPLQQIHPEATKAAEAAECAGRQGKFWEAHDVLFAEPSRLKRFDLVTLPSLAGLDAGAFQGCLDGQASERVKSDIAEAASLGVRGTPTFFIGEVESSGKLRSRAVLSGSRPLQAFKEAIEKVLAQLR